jgi:hypothetical protein
MKKLLIILAFIIIGCDKDDSIDEQQFDCECETLPVYEPEAPNGVSTINIRPCWDDNDLVGATRETYLEELLDMERKFALQIANSQGCKN